MRVGIMALPRPLSLAALLYHLNHQSVNIVDKTAPAVSSFDVQPRSNVGGFTITGAGLDTDGSGVKRFEIYRAVDKTGAPDSLTASDWQKQGDYTASNLSSGVANDPAPATATSYWYGLHIVDNFLLCAKIYYRGIIDH